ncbi:MAG TPA: hypothetical protein DEP42_07510 [Ruminococcaceae bacterium]|mgnify:CR=1 FL=1|nr:hypothetical protein [Oscillospiraceae bacterium]
MSKSSKKKRSDGRIPPDFLELLKKQFGMEIAASYRDALSIPPKQGLRINLLKTEDVAAFAEKAAFSLLPLPFAQEGFYLKEGMANGRHPWHHAGLYYLQEPSAMSAVTALCPRSGQKILDMCAAPGGKSTQIASRLKGKGLLVSNEIMPARAKALRSNIERFGVRNAYVFNEKTERIAAAFPEFFDSVLVDAPCSGEGMFRREPAAAAQWTPSLPLSCAKRQLAILENAAKTVRSGGTLVYSTCTFAPEENEQVIAAFLGEHPLFSLEPIAAEFGRPAFLKFANGCADMTLARRIFPQDGGEGHFVARLHKAGLANEMPGINEKHVMSAEGSLFSGFFAEQFDEACYGLPYRVEDRIFILPSVALPSAAHQLHSLCSGVFAGRIKNKRFEPTHALYLAAVGKSCKRQLNFPLQDSHLLAYLHGEQIEANLPNGYAAVLADGYPVGFGKCSNGALKNHYPRALRNL